MTDKINKYSNFNIDQLVPILSDLFLAKMSVSNMILSVGEYMTNLYDLINELKTSNKITDEFKFKIDKNVEMVLNSLSTDINQKVGFKNLGTKKEKLFERLQRGISYKYKLSNGFIAENPKLIEIDVVRIDVIHRTIEIGTKIFQFSDSSDYVPHFGSSSCVPYYGNDMSGDCLVKLVLKNLNNEIKKSLTIQAFLDILVDTTSLCSQSIKLDIITFNLFDEKLLDDLDKDHY